MTLTQAILQQRELSNSIPKNESFQYFFTPFTIPSTAQNKKMKINKGENQRLGCLTLFGPRVWIFNRGGYFYAQFPPIAPWYLLRLRHSHFKTTKIRMSNMPKVAPILVPPFHSCENQGLHWRWQQKLEPSYYSRFLSRAVDFSTWWSKVLLIYILFLYFDTFDLYLISIFLFIVPRNICFMEGDNNSWDRFIAIDIFLSVGAQALEGIQRPKYSQFLFASELSHLLIREY